MDQTITEARARYLIEDRIYGTQRRLSVHDRGRHRRLRDLKRL
jgi:hypothetical protein